MEFDDMEDGRRSTSAIAHCDPCITVTLCSCKSTACESCGATDRGHCARGVHNHDNPVKQLVSVMVDLALAGGAVLTKRISI